MLDQTQELSKQNNKTLEEIKKSLTDIRDTITGTTDEINKALTGSKSYYKQMASTVDTAFANHGTKSKESAATLDTMAGQTGDLVTKYKKLRDSIEALDRSPGTFCKEPRRCSHGCSCTPRRRSFRTP